MDIEYYHNRHDVVRSMHYHLVLHNRILLDISFCHIYDRHHDGQHILEFLGNKKFHNMVMIQPIHIPYLLLHNLMIHMWLYLVNDMVQNLYVVYNLTKSQRFHQFSCF